MNILRNLKSFILLFVPLAILASLYMLAAMQVEYPDFFQFNSWKTLAFHGVRFLYAVSLFLTVLSVMGIAAFVKLKGGVSILLTLFIISALCAAYPAFVRFTVMPQFEQAAGLRLSPQTEQRIDDVFRFYGGKDGWQIRAAQADGEDAPYDFRRPIAVKRGENPRAYFAGTGTQRPSAISLSRVYSYAPDTGEYAYSEGRTVRVSESHPSYPVLDMLFAIPMLDYAERFFLRLAKASEGMGLSIWALSGIFALIIFIFLIGVYNMAAAVSAEGLRFHNAAFVLLFYLGGEWLILYLARTLPAEYRPATLSYPVLAGIAVGAGVLLILLSVAVNAILRFHRRYQSSR